MQWRQGSQLLVETHCKEWCLRQQVKVSGAKFWKLCCYIETPLSFFLVIRTLFRPSWCSHKFWMFTFRHIHSTEEFHIDSTVVLHSCQSDTPKQELNWCLEVRSSFDEITQFWEVYRHRYSLRSLSLFRSCQPVCGLWDLAVFQNGWNKMLQTKRRMEPTFWFCG